MPEPISPDLRRCFSEIAKLQTQLRDVAAVQKDQVKRIAKVDATLDELVRTLYAEQIARRDADLQFATRFKSRNPPPANDVPDRDSVVVKVPINTRGIIAVVLTAVATIASIVAASMASVPTKPPAHDSPAPHMVPSVKESP